MGFRHTAEHTHREAPQDCTSSGRENVTAYSAGSVCCPTMRSTILHADRGESAFLIEGDRVGGYVHRTRPPMQHGGV